MSPVTIRLRPPVTRLTVVPERGACLYYESLCREAARMKRRHGPRWWQHQKRSAA